jgi:hypothetical protein
MTAVGANRPLRSALWLAEEGVSVPFGRLAFCHATFPAMTSFRGTAEVTQTFISV